MRRALPILALLLLPACATSSRPGEAPPLPETVRVPGPNGGTMAAIEIQHTTSPAARTFFRPPDEVWAALPAVYAELSIPIEERDVASRTIGNPAFRVRRRLADVPLGRYLDCGSTQGSSSADSYEILLSVETHVQPADAGAAVVTTVVEARGRPVAFSADYVTCGTRGALEKRFFEILAAHLKG